MHEYKIIFKFCRPPDTIWYINYVIYRLRELINNHYSRDFLKLLTRHFSPVSWMLTRQPLVPGLQSGFSFQLPTPPCSGKVSHEQVDRARGRAEGRQGFISSTLSCRVLKKSGPWRGVQFLLFDLLLFTVSLRTLWMVIIVLSFISV